MTALDEITNYIDPKGVSPKDTIIRFGVIGGLGLIIYSLIGFLTGFGSPANGLMMVFVNIILVIVLYAVLMVFAVKNHKEKELGGYITLGRGFTVAFLVGLLTALISTLFSYIYINFIDPNYLISMAEGSAEMFQNFGMTDAQIEEQIDTIKEGGSIVANLKNLAWGSVVGALLSLIIAASMKKNYEQIEE